MRARLKIINTHEKRPATAGEIEKMVSNGELYFNWHVNVIKPEDEGIVIIELDASGFDIEFLKEENNEAS